MSPHARVFKPHEIIRALERNGYSRTGQKGSHVKFRKEDTTKEVVAMGHSYFALQTHRQEVEDKKRLQLRQEMKEHNKNLASAAKQAVVEVVAPYHHGRVS